MEKVGDEGVITRRGVEDHRDAARGRRGPAVRPRLPLALLRHRCREDGGGAGGRRSCCSPTGKIGVMKDLLPLLEQVARAGQPPGRHRGGRRGRGAGHAGREQDPRARSGAWRSRRPGFGDRRKEMLEDIAILTGGRVLTEELGVKLENVDLADLGRVPARGRRPGQHHAHRRRRRQAGIEGRKQQIRRRSRRPRATTTGRSSRSGWPSSRAAWRSSASARRPRPR